MHLPLLSAEHPGQGTSVLALELGQLDQAELPAGALLAASEQGWGL